MCSPIGSGLRGFQYGGFGFCFGRYWSGFGCNREKDEKTIIWRKEAHC